MGFNTHSITGSVHISCLVGASTHTHTHTHTHTRTHTKPYGGSGVLSLGRAKTFGQVTV